MPQARPGPAGHVNDLNFPFSKYLVDVLPGLIGTAVRREPVVDGDDALVGDHVAGDAAGDADRVEALMVGQPVHIRLPGLIIAQPVENAAGLVDRVAAHPGPGAVGPLAAGHDVRAQRALAAALDHAASRLEQDREVASEQVGAVAAEPAEAVTV